MPLVIIGGGSFVEIDGGVLRYFAAHIEGEGQLFANGTFISINAGITIDGISEFYALGRIGDEPNIFGVGDFGGQCEVLIGQGTLGIRGKCIIAGSSSLLLRPQVAEAERSELNIILTIADLPGVGFAATYGARIFADGIAYPIRGYTITEGTADVGTSLNVTLQKPTQRAAILAADQFKFELNDNGVWKTVFDTGRRIGAGFSYAWANARPSDGLSLSTAGPISAKLEKSPRRNLTIYDPIREEISAADFAGVLDENGVLYSHELKAIGDMKLRGLLDYVFETRCGFTRVETDLPNDPIRRLDVQMTDTFNGAIATVIGIYRPLVFVVDDVLYILDGTKYFPAGFAQPVALDHTQYKNAQLQITDQAADGFVVQYVDSERDYDYYSDREVDVPASVFGSEGSSDYTETEGSITYRDFYKLSSPATPMRTEKIEQITTVRGILDGELTELSETTETIEFDSKLRLKSIDKRKTASIPDIISGTFPIISREIRHEATTFEYKPDIKNPRREVMSKRSTRITGLCITDTENESAGRPFRQEFYDAWRSGNFLEGQTVDTATIATEIETLEQSPRGQNELRFLRVDYMTNPPNVHADVTEARGGDATTNAQTSAPKEVVVYRTGLTDRTDAKLVRMDGGEFRITNLKALAKRRLDKRQSHAGSIELKGLNLSFARGSVLTLLDRGGNVVASFVVEGRTITGSNLGTREQTTSQILNVTEIATNGPPLSIGVAQAGGILLNAGGTAAFTLPINCADGYELAAEADDPEIRFWAKATAGGSFQNLHTSPIDLTPFAGTTHTFYFELRIDGSAVDGNSIVKIIVQPN